MSQARGPVLFVSHHSSQVHVAEHVERALNAKGVRCWIAPRDVEPGASFARAIPDAIGESSAVLLLFCSNSAKSPHVERELILADQLSKAIIPLRIEKIVDPGGLRYHLAAAQWIDWLEQRDAAIDRIAARAFEFAQSAPPAPPERSTPHTAAFASHQPAPPSGGPQGFESAPGHGGGYGGPPPIYPPSPPASAGSGSKGLLFAIAGLAAVALIALGVWLVVRDQSGLADIGSDTAATTGGSGSSAYAANPSQPAGQADAAPVTAEWFAGTWAETRDCEEMYRFDLGGMLTGPDGEQGSWYIENGNTLVATVEGVERRREMRRISNNEIGGAQGPAYRCLPGSTGM